MSRISVTRILAWHHTSLLEIGIGVKQKLINGAEAISCEPRSHEASVRGHSASLSILLTSARSERYQSAASEIISNSTQKRETYFFAAPTNGLAPHTPAVERARERTR